MKKTISLILCFLLASILLVVPTAESINIPEKDSNWQKRKAEVLSLIKNDLENSANIYFYPKMIYVQSSALLDIKYNTDGKPVSICGIDVEDIKFDYYQSEYIKGIFPVTYYVITLPSDEMVDDAIDILNARDEVCFAHRHFYMLSHSEALKPTDSEKVYYEDSRDDDASIAAVASVTYDSTDQWALNKIGVGSAWGQSFTGSSSIDIAVIDTGYRAHSDMSGRVDTLNALNATNSTDPIYYDNVYDYVGQGTRTISIIAAKTNGSYMSGVCQNVNIIPIKAAIPQNDGGNVTIHTDDDWIDVAVAHAIFKNAEIMLLNVPLNETYYAHIATRIESFNGIIITNAGDEGQNITLTDNAGKTSLPTNKTLIVGASTQSDYKWSSSNYSNTKVHLFAPGYNIYSYDYTSTATVPFNKASSTAYAAAHVAAACALIMSKATHLSAVSVRNHIYNYCELKSTLTNYCMGGRRLSVFNATDVLFTTIRPRYSKGDIDGDTYISNSDKAACLSIINGEYPLPIPAEVFNAADVNSDGVINTLDYMQIGRYISRTFYFPPY